MKTKSELRNRIAQKRRALDPHWTANASAQIAERMQAFEAFQIARTVALYKAISGEVALDRLFPTCWAQGKRTCIPVFNADLNIYEWAEITEQTTFRTGNYGIQEPEQMPAFAMNPIDLMVVPGVAFDADGNRLGRGGGYYDRLLADFPGVAVAVAFDFQVLPRIPHTTHDIPVDYVITEREIIKAQNEH